jgi:putative salt-induced outer membrane protein YdiY
VTFASLQTLGPWTLCVRGLRPLALLVTTKLRYCCFLVGTILWLLSGFVEVWSADSRLGTVSFATPALTTNYVLVTNVVLVVVTNYVVTTNVVLTTKDLARARTAPQLPELNWAPPDDGFDWIQLKSGEWLKGKFKGMQRRKLEFDSEELDLLSFDWKDIRQVRSPRIQDVLLDNQESVSGPIAVTPNEVRVTGENGLTFRRSDLESITPGGSKERNYWSGKLALGLTFHSGNNTQLDYNAQGSLQRRTPDTRLNMAYVGNLSRIGGVENANNHRANTEFDYFLTSRLYVLTPMVDYFRDPFQNVAHRVTAGIGVGYDIIYRPKLEWTMFVGPAYQHSWFDSVQPAQPGDDQGAAAVFGSRLDWEINRRLDLTLEYRGQVTSREAGQTSHHGAAILDVKITKRFDLDVAFLWDRTDSPTAESNGDVPKSNDFRLVVGLGLRF